MGITITHRGDRQSSNHLGGSKPTTEAANSKERAFTPRVQSTTKKMKGENNLGSPVKALRTSTPKVFLSDLHDPETGRLDAHRLAEHMGVPLKTFSEGLGLIYKTVHRNPSSAAIQKALRPVKRSLELLDLFFGKPEVARAWLNTPHPELDGFTALETILENKAEAVELLLENAWNGVPV